VGTFFAALNVGVPPPTRFGGMGHPSNYFSTVRIL
jgi:hypothetical protein